MTELGGIEKAPSLIATLERVVGKLKPVGPETKALEIRCPEGVAIVSIYVKASPAIRAIRPKIAIPFTEASRLKLFGMGSLSDQSGIVERQETGFLLDVSRLPALDEGALLTVEYSVNRAQLLHSLVSTGQKADVVGTHLEDRYWMHAGLRNPAALEKSYGKVDLRDIDVHVNVGIYEKLLAAIPRPLTQRIRTLATAVAETDRTKRFRALMQYQHQRLAAPRANDLSQLGALRTLFSTGQFRRFVEVGNPFHFTSSTPGDVPNAGRDLFDLPTFVDVVSRVDLDLQTPAASSHLVYKAKDLMEHIQDMLSSGEWLVASQSPDAPETQGED